MDSSEFLKCRVQLTRHERGSWYSTHKTEMNLQVSDDSVKMTRRLIYVTVQWIRRIQPTSQSIRHQLWHLIMQPKSHQDVSYWWKEQEVSLYFTRLVQNFSEHFSRVLLPTAYVVRTSVCPHRGWGGTPARSRRGVGVVTPARSSRGCTPVGVPHLGYPHPPVRPGGGYPCWGYPPSYLAWGVPHLGYPHQTWPGGYPDVGYPTLGTPSDLTRGYPRWGTPSDLARGYPRWGTPSPIRPGWGYPSGGGYPSSGTPLSDLARGVPHPRCHPPPSPPRSNLGGGGPHLVHDNRWSTWYATVGMPLAFTQEDFLVSGIKFHAVMIFE